MSSVNVYGIDRAELLAALYNGTKALGSGWVHDLKRVMTTEEAQKILASAHAFQCDYVLGRPIKMRIRGDQRGFTQQYDRDAPGGEGSAARIVEQLLSKTLDQT